MTRTNPKPSEMHRSTKFLLASLASAATLSGWAWLTVTAPPPATDAAADEPTEMATLFSTVPPTNPVSVALVMTPVPSLTPLPSLKQLPVRGLRYVGDATATPLPVPTNLPTNPPSAPQGNDNQPSQNNNQPSQNNNQPKEKANAGGAPQAPPPAATDPPKPKPKPTHKAKPSK